MSILNIAKNRGIREILHFTRGDNLVGILAQGAVLSRNILDSRRQNYEALEYVGDPAWPDRTRDTDWWGYINLSLEVVNETLLDRARRNHPDQRWFLLSFSTELLIDPGVIFTTTNNAYSPYVERGEGAEGFLLPFTDAYRDAVGKLHRRDQRLETQYPTSQQAEVLYPSSLSLKYLNKIYVEDTEGASHANLAKYTQEYMDCEFHDFEIEINPDKFHANIMQEKY